MEKQYCERCGNPINDMFGSGRFCSRSCANARKHTSETKAKIKATLRTTLNDKNFVRAAFDKSYKRCSICNKIIDVTEKNRKTYYLVKTCGSKECKTASRIASRRDPEAFKEKCRKNAFKNNFGGFNMHKIKYVVNGQTVDSSYEKTLAESLDENKVRWERPCRLFYVDDQGKKHSYTADFYLPDYNVYLDPKNDYLINNINPILKFKDVDKIRWVCEQNNVKVFILDKEHLTFDKIIDIISS